MHNWNFNVAPKRPKSPSLIPSDQAAVDEMMARWIAAIADQVGNPLASISAATDLMSKEIGRLHDLDSGIDSNLGQIVGMMKIRLESLTSYLAHLKTFAHEIKLDNRPILVKDIVKNSIMGTSDKSGDQLIVHSRCVPEHLSITADPAKLETAISAILANAIEAVPVERTPEILISVAPCPTSEKEVLIVISDNGNGFQSEDPEDLRRPFQSTKEAGDGLGLSTAEKIVKAHRGRIEIVPVNGILGGADVHIILPIGADPHNADQS